MPSNFKVSSPEMNALLEDGSMPREHRGSRNQL